MLSAKIRTKWIIGRTKWIIEYFSYLAQVEYCTKWIRIKCGPGVYAVLITLKIIKPLSMRYRLLARVGYAGWIAVDAPEGYQDTLPYSETPLLHSVTYKRNCLIFCLLLENSNPCHQSKIQGISYWSVKSNSTLRGRRSNHFIEFWFIVGSGGLEIWVSSTSFQKSNIGCPQQPPTEKVLKFNMTFHDSTK